MSVPCPNLARLNVSPFFLVGETSSTVAESLSVRRKWAGAPLATATPGHTSHLTGGVNGEGGSLSVGTGSHLSWLVEGAGPPGGAPDASLVVVTLEAGGAS